MAGRAEGASTWGQIGGIVGSAIGIVAASWQAPTDLNRVEWIGFVTAGAAIGAIAGGLLGVLVGSRRRTASLPPQPPVDPALLDKWRSWLRAASYQRAQQKLEQLIQSDTVLERRAGATSLGRRIRLSATQTVLSDTVSRWAAEPARLVIIGEPGYGKTVSALTLIAAFDGGDQRTASPVAGLFHLSEWAAAEPGESDSPLAAWLVDRLVLEFGDDGLTPVVARQLIEQRLVIPVLDGLDELRPTERSACLRAVRHFAGAVAPFRPFVLTCRVEEYAELSTDWLVSADHIHLPGLTEAQIVELIEAEAVHRPAWSDLVARIHGSVDRSSLVALFSSPLRADLILACYREVSPSPLLDVDLSTAKDALWDLALTRSMTPFNGETPEQRLNWLRTLAATCAHHKLQRLHVHELDLLLGEPRFERFTHWVALAVLLVWVPLNVAFAFTGPLAWQIVVLTVPMAFFGYAEITSIPPRPRIWTLPAWTNWESFLESAAFVAGGAFAGFVGGATWGLWLGQSLSMRRGLVGLCVGACFGFAWAIMTPTRELAPSGGPVPLGPRALVATIRKGLAGTLAALLLTGSLLLAVGFASVPFMTTAEASPGVNLGGALIAAGGMTAVIAMRAGALFLFHLYWIRVRLARRDLMPFDVLRFLDWCADPARGWLRVSTAYEWRHRELLDYLNRRPGRHGD